MKYVLTFTNVYDSDRDRVGLPAYDLSKIARITKMVPPSFIITNDLFEDVIKAHPSLMNISDKALAQKTLSKLKFPSHLVEELKEAYYSLSIDEKNNLLSSKSPRVNLFVSSSHPQNFIKPVLNIKGFENFLDAIKTCWIRSFNEGFKKSDAAILVQKLVHADATIEFDSNPSLSAKIYKGLIDITFNADKDVAKLNLDDLSEFKYEVHSQEYKLVSHENSGLLEKIYLKETSFDPKISEHLLLDAARLVKKIIKEFNQHIFAVVQLKSGNAYCVFAYSSIDLKQEELEEHLSFADEDFSDEKIVQTEEEYEPTIPFENEDEQGEELDLKDLEVEGFISQIGEESHELVTLRERLVDKIEKEYTQGFGFAPMNTQRAIVDLSVKYDFDDADSLIEFIKISSNMIDGQDVDMDRLNELSKKVLRYLEK